MSEYIRADNGYLVIIDRTPDGYSAKVAQMPDVEVFESTHRAAYDHVLDIVDALS